MVMTRVGGVSALLGGVAWFAKGVVILSGGDQPPFLFEIAPVLFGIGLLSLAHTAAPSRRRTAAIVLAGIVILAGLVAAVTEVVGEVAGVAIATSSLALIVGLVTLDRHQPWPTPLAWWIGVATLPAILVVGGLLSAIDERLLEIPIVGLGIAWTVVGASLTKRAPPP